MKKFLVLVSLFLASGMSSAQWITQNTNTDGNFTDIVFVDEMTGWAVMADDYPQVHYTTDGGQTWQWCFELFGLLQGAGTSVSFFNADNGWLSDGANIFHTADGSSGCGSEWINQATESITMVSTCLRFTDSQHGWLVGNYDGGCNIYLSRFYRTDDGGATWNFVEAYGYRISDIHFISAQEGWALDLQSSGLQGASGLWHTTDGGQTWALASNEVVGAALFFTDPLTGWIAGYDEGTATGFIKHTADGGQSWMTQTTAGIPALNAITFADPFTGWAAGNGGTILHTVNGGQSWEMQASGTLANLNRISFTDENNGWICGNGGTILHTGNGGTVGTKELIGRTGSFSVFPNPAKGPVTLFFNTLENNGSRITVSDMEGNDIFHKEIPENQAQFNLDLSGYPRGIYFFTIQAGSRKSTSQLILQ